MYSCRNISATGDDNIFHPRQNATQSSIQIHINF